MGVRELRRGELRAKLRAELRGAQEVERQERAGDREEVGGGQDRDEAGERAKRVEDREAAHHERHLRRRVLLLREGAGEVLRAEEGGGEDLDRCFPCEEEPVGIDPEQGVPVITDASSPFIRVVGG